MYHHLESDLLKRFAQGWKTRAMDTCFRTSEEKLPGYVK